MFNFGCQEPKELNESFSRRGRCLLEVFFSSWNLKPSLLLNPKYRDRFWNWPCKGCGFMSPQQPSQPEDMWIVQLWVTRFQNVELFVFSLRKIFVFLKCLSQIETWNHLYLSTPNTNVSFETDLAICNLSLYWCKIATMPYYSQSWHTLHMGIIWQEHKMLKYFELFNVFSLVLIQIYVHK